MLDTVGLFAMTATAEATVLRAVVVETTDMTAYMDALAKVRAALERPGSPTAVRMWRARFVGPNAGAIIVAVAYPAMAAFAAGDVKTRGPAGYVPPGHPRE